MSLGVQGIYHIGVSVPDIDRALNFYIDLLGGVEEVPPLEWRDNAFIDAVVGLRDSAAKQFFCRLGNAHIEVFEYAQPHAAPQDPDKGVPLYPFFHSGG